MPLDGVIVPMVTPMTATGAVDADAVGRLIDRFAGAGVDGLLLAGTSGEGHALDARSLARLTEVAARRWGSHGRGQVYVAVSAPSTDEVLARAGAIAHLAPDALVVCPPYYFRYTDLELVDHYAALASLQVPIVAYDTPRYSNNPLNPVVLAALADLPHVVGLKDSTGDLDHLAAAIAAGTGRTFHVAQGDDGQLVNALGLGVPAVIPGIANIVPGACVELVRSWREGDRARAEALQLQLDRMNGIHRIRRGVVATKATLALMGWCGPSASRPFLGFDGSELAALRVLLGELRDLVGPLGDE